ncbi:glycoside hydrolase family 16 protein [Catenovulum maritimum]|uniref:Glycosyl hydrolase family 16 n=1 Tax=Catenovulum maritimum TaxID=1513271 RepID=A0A0J8GNT4_9ALTE|nr:glycoside hydrolase family 16 protein [Catenovulum maritimum]KMT64442.1 glycosyl hydrolase family 16 [Catenovulum maritimum]
MNIAVKHLGKLSTLAVMISLTGCGSDIATNTDIEAVDTTSPVSDWKMVWNDEFDGTSINMSKWSHEVDCSGGGNQEEQCYTDSAENSYVSDGTLKIVALPAEDAAKPYTSARLRTLNQGDWTYGRFEVRAKLPQGQGTWPAFWMLPTDEVYGGWPHSGEIDILEAVNLKVANDDGTLQSSIYGTLHYGKSWPDNVSSGKEYVFPQDQNPADDFHTYAIEWQEGEIRWYVDGYLYQTQRRSEVRYNSKGEASGLKHQGWFAEYYSQQTGELENHWTNAPYDQDFHLLLNLAVGGSWPANVNDTGIDETAFENGGQVFEIDYVRVYECALDPNTGRGCETLRKGYDSEEDALVLGKAPKPAAPTPPGPAQNLTIFADANNPDWPIWDCCGGSTPTVETDGDYGAVAEFIIGSSPTVMGFNTNQSDEPKPYDASSFVATGKVEFDMKVVTPPNDASAVWKFKIEQGGTSTAVELDLTDSIEGVAPVTGEWQHYSFSLQDLADKGLDVSGIDVLMIFPAWGSGEGAVYRVDNVTIGSPENTAGASVELVLFEDTSNLQWPIWDCCGGSTPTEETDDADHNTVAEFIIGASPTVMGFLAEDNLYFDASSIQTEGVVQFEMKVTSAPNDAAAVWKFKVESGDTTTAVELDLTDSNEGLAPATGVWQTYTFPLQMLADQGLDTSAIDVIMIFPAWGTGEGAVYRVDNAKIYNPNAVSAPAGLDLFKDMSAANWSIWDCCGGSTPAEQTDDAPYGTVAEFAIGASPTVMGFLADDNVYFDAEALAATGSVKFDMKVVTAPNDAAAVWKFKIESGDTTTAVELDLTDSNEGLAPATGVWQTYTFPLQKLADEGLDLTAIDVVMIFPAWGTGEGAVYRVDNASISAQ